jgi:predicted transcriptional regulator
MPEENNLVAMTIEVVASYVAHNNIRPEDVPDFITKTHAAITGIAKEPEAPTEPAPPAEAEYTPAVTVRKSLASPDHILSMIDGKPYKTLKRHLGTHGLTPAEYRARYGLKADYPMVAPGYSEQRRDVAKRLGLGRKRQEPAPGAEAQQPAPAVEAPAQPKQRRGRRPRAADAPAVVTKTPRRRKAQAAAETNDKG